MSVLSIDTQPPSGVDIHALRTRLDGDLIVPGDPRWDEARRAWNLALEQPPFAVALVGFARVHGLRFAAQGTGHGASALEAEDTILVKTERMRGVEIDAAASRARVEAGAIWADVVEPAAEQGFVPPLPMVPEPLRGNSFAVVEAVFAGPESDGAALIQPLRELGPAPSARSTRSS
jgi:FAD binding domain